MGGALEVWSSAQEHARQRDLTLNPNGTKGFAKGSQQRK